MARNFNADTSRIDFAASSERDNVFAGGGTISYSAKSNGVSQTNVGIFFSRQGLFDGTALVFDIPSTMVFIVQAFTTSGKFNMNAFIVDNTNYNNFNIEYDTNALTTQPIARENNVTQTVTTDVTPVGSYSEDPEFRLGRAGSEQPVFGFFAEFAIWNNELTTFGRTQVNAGVSPFVVERSKLRVYLPMYGSTSIEPEYGPGNIPMTVTDTPGEKTHANVQLIETYL